jgi:electron transfer flavoprotein beta subunit
MNIIACVKQVPASSEVEVDPKTGVLIRDGSNVKTNPFDLYALEAAFEIKERMPGAVVHAVTMGPPSAKQVLEESLSMGADRATLITDRAFAGADVLATSYTLSQLIRHIGAFDLIVCGRQTTDGDTAQVGPEIAEFLDIPHIPYVSDIRDITDGHVIVRSSYASHDEILKATLPCLLTIDKAHRVPRLPSFVRKRAMRDVPIHTVTLGDLRDADPGHYGLNGSPTQVEEVFPPEQTTTSVRVTGTKEETADALMALLKERKFL